MQALLKLSRAIDWLSALVGRWVIWLILASTVISAVNAVVRKVFNTSSNAYLEVQWYLFAAAFLLAAGYTLLNGEHVKIDVVYSRLSRKTQNWIDVFGFVAFLLPMCLIALWFAVPFFLQGLYSGEMSSNAGGLIRWPVFALLPLGFVLLGFQAISELIKRVAFLKGLIPDPTQRSQEKTAEEELAEFLLQKEVAAREAAAGGKP
jgi:TRAP-type mannitol/chloroaromatic compound transport system permease small subunit